MSETCYSLNEEYFNHTEIEDAVREAFDYVGAQPGDIRTIYEGTTKEFKAGDFAPRYMEEMLAEQAYDDGGEYAENWLSGLRPEQKEDLAKRIKEAINAWADDHALHPTFYGVENVREIKVKLLDDDDNFEIV